MFKKLAERWRSNYNATTPSHQLGLIEWSAIYAFASWLDNADVYSITKVIEKEIKWCEEFRGMKSEVYEEAFIAGLKQVLFFINSISVMESEDEAL